MYRKGRITYTAAPKKSDKQFIIVASGNESADTKNFYPASEEKLIVVSATDQNDNIADFSNTGTSIDLSAPGVDIISSMPGQHFASMSGTSMATPFISSLDVET